MGGMPHARKMLDAAIVRQFFFSVFPIAPTGKVTAWLKVDVASYICRELVDQLNYFDRLKNDKGI